jgi:hypothetical protein
MLAIAKIDHLFGDDGGGASAREIPSSCTSTTAVGGMAMR